MFIFLSSRQIIPLSRRLIELRTVLFLKRIIQQGSHALRLPRKMSIPALCSFSQTQREVFAPLVLRLYYSFHLIYKSSYSMYGINGSVPFTVELFNLLERRMSTNFYFLASLATGSDKAQLKCAINGGPTIFTTSESVIVTPVRLIV